MEERWAVRFAIALCVATLTSGCAQSLPSMGRDELTVDELPGIEEADLSGAELVVNATGCREVHMLLDGNRSRTAEAVQPFDLARQDGNRTELAVTVTRCQQLSTPSLDTNETTLIEVSAPIDRDTREPVRDDALLAVMTTNPRLSERLAEVGLPVRELDKFTRDAGQDYSIAEQATVDVDDERYPFESTFTAVSVETELPFGTAGSIGRDRWVQHGNETLTVETGLNVTELGGVSATLETRPGSRMAELWGNTTRSAHGFQASYDARVGVLVDG